MKDKLSEHANSAMGIKASSNPEFEEIKIDIAPPKKQKFSQVPKSYLGKIV